jgi:hypothetical protein
VIYQNYWIAKILFYNQELCFCKKLKKQVLSLRGGKGLPTKQSSYFGYNKQIQKCPNKNSYE